VRIGIDGLYSSAYPAHGVQTILDLAGAANLDGSLTTATFGWTTGPCPAAVKIKVFRRALIPVPTGEVFYNAVAERGPYDVPSLGDPPPPFPFPVVVATVTLDPPVAVRRGDLIGITRLTPCGGPYTALPPPGSAPGDAIVFDGDVGSGFVGTLAPRTPALLVSATGPTPVLGLLSDRFAATLTARDPRTQRTASGTPVRLGNGSGYFSLPEITGDSVVPEVTVKMVDATASPALGGTFWFFYAPLTDMEFDLTVVDQFDGSSKTYRSLGTPGGGELCGAADTSAFDP
jgi:hypothetical protein